MVNENQGAVSKSSGQFTLMQASNVPEFSPHNMTWHIWNERLEIHYCEIGCTEDNQKKAILLKSVGAEAYNVIHNLCSPNLPSSKTYKELCQMMNMHYTPPTIIFHERKQFHMSHKRADETVAAWYARVKQLAFSCKFGSHLDAFVLDKFIVGMSNDIFERLCEEDESITIEQALRKALIFETKIGAKSCLKDNSECAEGAINYVNRGRKKYNFAKKQNTSDENAATKKRKPCSHCGWRNHDATTCRYKDSKCHSCGKVGHLASVCKYKQDKNKNINYVSHFDCNENINDFYNNSIFSIGEGTRDGVYTLPVSIEGMQLEAACDTGAPCTLIPAKMFKKMRISTLRTCNVPYVDFSGDRIKILGEFDALVTFRKMSKKVVVVVTNTENPPLLGRSFLRAFNFDLCQVNNIGTDGSYTMLANEIMNEFSSVFTNELGAFVGDKVSLKLCKDAKPIFHKPRPLALAWKSKVEQKLREFVDQGMLEFIDNSEWGTPLVPIVKPNGDIRICADYKVTINKYLVDFKYPLPRIDEIFAALEGGELFTKLDLSQAYNQLILDDESQLLCTWSTHIGILKVKRLPFGIKTAAAIFQKTIENLLRGFQYVVVYQDDITVTGPNTTSHMITLKAVLNKLKSAGLKLNRQKCNFFQKHISYLGFTIDKEGLRKSNERIACVINAPIPNNVSEVRAFTGMVNYYSKFIDRFAEKMNPLYELLRKNTKFIWSTKCEKAYNTIKSDVASDNILVHFNPDVEIVLTTDACNTAVAGILAHRYDNNVLKPVAFVSRALQKSEIRYSTIEKEALAIIFSVSKLKQYLLGRKFTLRTDHKPLLAILGEHRGLPLMASARMQRWALLLSGFNYSIEYVKGTSNEADKLSRIPQIELSDEQVDEYTYINFIKDQDQLNLNFKNIAIQTRRDPILAKLLTAIESGSVFQLQEEIYKPYKSKENELSVDHGCIMWGYRILVPTKLRNNVLKCLHSSHLGVVKTKALARSYIWWPSLDKEIEKVVSDCASCQEVQESPCKSVLTPWKPEISVWKRIHIDFAGPIKNQYLFIVVDSYSKWPEVFVTKQITSNFTIARLRELFCRYGLVDVLVSDNGRQFTSFEFKNFMNRNNVKHVLTAPGHPSTNGQAEIFVKVLKKAVYAKLKESPSEMLETAVNRFLADYRNTKHCTTDETPSKLFFGRSLKTRLDSLRPPTTREIILRKQQKNIANYGGKRKIEFNSGQRVYIRDYRNPNKSSWSPATIEKKLGAKTYLCNITDNGHIIKRHTDQIRKIVDLKIDETPHEDKNIAHKVEHKADQEEEKESKIESSVEVSSREVTNDITPKRILRPRKDGKVLK